MVSRMPPRSPNRSLRAVAGAVVAAAALVTAGAASSVSAAPEEGDLEAARDRLSELQGEFESITEQAGALRDRIESIQEDMADTERIVRRLAKQMLAREQEAVDIAGELYKGGTAAGLEAVMSSDSLAEIDAQLAYLESSEESRSKIFYELAADRAELEAELDNLDAQRASAVEAQGELVALQDDVQADIAAQEGEIEDIQAAIAAAERREAAEEAAAAAAAAEAAEAAAAEAEEAATEPPPPVTAPTPDPPAGGYSADWDAIAQCESGGRWHLNSTYDGGLQFHPDTWLAYGGGRYARYAWQASREQQIAIAEKVLAGQGPGAWPNCFVSN
jgi:peptidoglycan hydrolase CwlO-like protein